MKRLQLILIRAFFSALFISFFALNELMARAGGGGGGHGGGGGGHGGGGGGGGGGGFGGGGFHTYGSPDGGGSIGPFGLILVIVIVVIILYVRRKAGPVTGYEDEAGAGAAVPPSDESPLPEGLDPQKVKTAFLGIQVAWQNKDLREVRKWISDGVYQRYTTQFSIMNKLEQVNRLSNIRVNGIQLAKTSTDGKYKTADVAISFTIDDEFLSKKYPAFNESFMNDSDTEYWTFVKRGDAKEGKNLYDNNNCPNCGAPLEIKLGEISRCAHCNSLTNNATFDWVLSEITQADDYNRSNAVIDPQLAELTKNDDLFALTRLEDMASNAFMQVMDVLTGGNAVKLSRFADKNTIAAIMQIKERMGNFVFDRLYLNDVNMVGYNTDNGRLNLTFRMEATYQRVQAGDSLRWIDPNMVTTPFTMALSKNLSALQTPKKETVYSYECPHCGAPLKDTTSENCSYCGEAIVDLNSTWVVTQFGINV